MIPEDIRDMLFYWLYLHDTHCCDENCKQPADILAYLCHCAGLHSDNLGDFLAELRRYEDTCEEESYKRN